MTLTRRILLATSGGPFSSTPFPPHCSEVQALQRRPQLPAAHTDDGEGRNCWLSAPARAPYVAALQAQATKESTKITEKESLQLTRNLLRIAVFNISYIRGLFPDKFFEDKYVPALEMTIKKLMPVNDESKRLIDWLEKVSFTYAGESLDSQVIMSVACNESTAKAKPFKAPTADISPQQMKNSACKMVRTLVQLMRTLDSVPEEPREYEPPFFRHSPPEEQLLWSKTPLRMKIGEVKSVLDPCEAGPEDNKSQGRTQTNDGDGDSTDSDEEEMKQGPTSQAPKTDSVANVVEGLKALSTRGIVQSVGSEMTRQEPAAPAKRPRGRPRTRALARDIPPSPQPQVLTSIAPAQASSNKGQAVISFDDPPAKNTLPLASSTGCNTLSKLPQRTAKLGGYELELDSQEPNEGSQRTRKASITVDAINQAMKRFKSEP
eukprot:SM000397S15165  [mRNA]  locus=s397:11923:15181:+ [translate_table: standard]